jgi:hypothetical protein
MKFPSWDDIAYSAIKKYEKKISLPKDFYKHFSKQCRSLKRNYKFLSVIEPHLVIKLMEKIKWGHPKIEESTLREIEAFKENHPIAYNQFITIGNSHASNFAWFDPRLSEILNINEGNFSLDALCAIDKNLNLYNPLDVKHVIRFGILAFFILTLKGMEFTAAQDYYVVKFRIGKDNFTPAQGVNGSVKVVERKCYTIPTPSDKSNNSTQHLDLWTVNESFRNFDHITTDFVRIGKPKWSRFVNTLFYIFNALVLGYKPKDVIVLHFLDKYDQADESRACLNRELRKVSNQNIEFNNKAFNDFSYGLNKKLSETMRNYTVVEKRETMNFDRLNRLHKAKQLGLLPIPNEIQDIILQGVV